jgi:hypothetical protein
MSEGPVSGAGTAPVSEPNGSANTPTPTVTPTVPPASATEPLGDVQASQDLNNLVNGGGEERTPEQEIAHWKEMARKNEARARENRDKALRFDAIEEANKTELQRATERAERAEKLAEETRAQSFRVAAIAQYELPADIAPLLQGATEDEINASAEGFARIINERVQALTSRNGNGQPERQTGGRPIEMMRPGAAPSNQSSAPQDSNGVFRGMIGRR